MPFYLFICRKKIQINQNRSDKSKCRVFLFIPRFWFIRGIVGSPKANNTFLIIPVTEFPRNSDKMCNLVPSSNHSPATICTHTALGSHLFTNVWQLTKLESWKFCISEFYLYFCDKYEVKYNQKSSNMGCFLSRQDINDVHSDTFSVINVDDQVRYFYQSEFSKFTKLKKGI